MDYEKKYKEAVNKIRDLLDDGEKNGFTIVTYKTDLESIFPELKESEDEKVRKEIVEYLKKNLRLEWATWLEKQCKKPQRMISAEAKEAMYDKPADTVELKCEESKTRIFDTSTPFEDKLYAFVLACEILVGPSKREFILEHSQEILDAAKEQIGKEQSSTWSKEDEKILNGLISNLVRIEANTRTDSTSINYTFPREINWLKALKQRCTWKPSDEQMKCLSDVVHKAKYKNDISVGGYSAYMPLASLYLDLKKLREE